MKFIAILTLLTFLSGISEISAQKDSISSSPKVELVIALAKDTFNRADDIPIKMIIVNNRKISQKLLFDKPESSTGGPAWTSVSLINKKTGRSVLKHSNKRVLESQIYSENQLKDKYYNLQTGQRLSREFSLFDLAVTDAEDYKLEKGTYELQVFYYNNHSNILTFTVL